MEQRPELRPPADPLEGRPLLGREHGAPLPAEGRQQEMAPVPGRRVVGYERYGDWLLPVYEAPPVSAPPVEQPRRGMDPIAQRLWAAGGGTLLAGVGGWLFFNPVTAVCLVAVAVIVLVLRSPRGVTNNYVTNNNRWWGTSTTTTK